MAKLAYATDSKSVVLHWACGFDPHLSHHNVESLSDQAHPVEAAVKSDEVVRLSDDFLQPLQSCEPRPLRDASSFQFGNRTRTTSPRWQFIVDSHFGPIPILCKLK